MTMIIIMITTTIIHTRLEKRYSSTSSDMSQ